jgi:hypothetical protein
MVHPSFLRYLLGHGTRSATVTTGVSDGVNRTSKGRDLRHDKGVLEEPILLDRVSDIVFILCADISTDEINRRLKMHVRDMLKHGRRRAVAGR